MSATGYPHPMYGQRMKFDPPPPVDYNNTKQVGIEIVWPDGTGLLEGLKIKEPPHDWQVKLATTRGTMILWADLPPEEGKPLRLGVGRTLGIVADTDEKWCRVVPTRRDKLEVATRSILGALGGHPKVVAVLDTEPLEAARRFLMNDMMWIVPNGSLGVRFAPDRWKPAAGLE